MLHSHHATRAAFPVALLLCLALAPAAAHAAPRNSWSYDVTVNAEMSYKWDFKEVANMGSSVDPCTRTEVASGGAKLQVHTPRPQRVGVYRGGPGRPPTIATGPLGLAIRGSEGWFGTDEERHEGPKCGPANPPRSAPTSDCGERNVRGHWSLLWTTDPGTLFPVMSTGNRPANCPAGPPRGLQWENAVQPTIAATVAHANPEKFYGTKQFTIHGSRTFRGTVPLISQPHFSRSGQAEMTWQWQTTYRLVPAKKHRRKRRRR